MMVSTRGRYALRVMIELAEHGDGGYIPMKEIAEKQGISLKYLERIVPVLVKNDLLEGIQGKSGGYRLTRASEDYKVGEILRLTEGDLAPVSCLECGAERCEHTDNCRTLPMWNNLHDLINDYLDSITLADLVEGNIKSLK
jgi:Rrf2 family protein